MAYFSKFTAFAPIKSLRLYVAVRAGQTTLPNAPQLDLRHFASLLKVHVTSGSPGDKIQMWAWPLRTESRSTQC